MSDNIENDTFIDCFAFVVILVQTVMITMNNNQTINMKLSSILCISAEHYEFIISCIGLDCVVFYVPANAV